MKPVVPERAPYKCWEPKGHTLEAWWREGYWSWRIRQELEEYRKETDVRAKELSHDRCELCEGYPDGRHCWTLADPEDVPTQDADETWYACRHCPAIGRECPECWGSGVFDDCEETEADCPVCEGYGVLDEVKAKE
jgi:hypothetical protein